MIISPPRGSIHALTGRMRANGWVALERLRSRGLSRHAPAAIVLFATLVCSATADAQAFTGGVQAATMLNNICTFILGPFGQSLAVLGIIAIGMSWMFGRASLGLVAGVIGGIIIMFAAGYIGTTLTGGSTGGSTG
jgi:type IV secretion system protein VirB2